MFLERLERVLFETATCSSAVAIVEDNGKYLFGLSTASDNRYNKWCFPGGLIKNGESLGEAAKRECLEETSIEVNPLQFRFYRDMPDVGFVVCEKMCGKPIPNHEFKDFRWMNKSEVAEEENTFEQNQEIIDSL